MCLHTRDWHEHQSIDAAWFILLHAAFLLIWKCFHTTLCKVKLGSCGLSGFGLLSELPFTKPRIILVEFGPGVVMKLHCLEMFDICMILASIDVSRFRDLHTPDHK